MNATATLTRQPFRNTDLARKTLPVITYREAVRRIKQMEGEGKNILQASEIVYQTAMIQYRVKDGMMQSAKQLRDNMYADRNRKKSKRRKHTKSVVAPKVAATKRSGGGATEEISSVLKLSFLSAEEQIALIRKILK